MERDSVSRAALIVAVLLALLLLYPGVPSGPVAKHNPAHQHYVAEEGTPAYDEIVGEATPGSASESDLRSVQYEELSPEARAAFDETLERPGRGEGFYAHEPVVCKDGFYLCFGTDESDLPPEFTYDQEASPSEAVLFVERGEQTYVFSTGAFGMPPGAAQMSVPADALFWPVAVAALLFLVPFVAVFGTGTAALGRKLAVGAGVGGPALLGLAVQYSTRSVVLALGSVFVLAGAAFAPEIDDRRLRTATVGFGAFVAAIAFLPSHVLPYTRFQGSSRIVVFVLPALVGAGALSLSVLALWRRHRSSPEVVGPPQ